MVARRQHRLWQRTLEAGDVLEVGCGSAYNAAILPSDTYVGIDLSARALALARASAPRVQVARATSLALPFAAATFDLAVDGASLMHVPRWRLAVTEGCRVARTSLVLHTVTITDEAPTTYLRKRAYGFVVPEVVCNRNDLVAALAGAGFDVERTWTGLDYNLHRYIGIPTTSQTWLARRANSHP